MLFNSHIFIFVFLPLTLAGWYFFNYRKRYRLAQGYLIGMSLWFYAYFDLRFLGPLAAGCLGGYVLCRLCGKEAVFQNGTKKRILTFVGCAFHLGMLGYYKYTNFFLENVNAAFGTGFAPLQILLPVGISFYTFQQLAYFLDCASGETKVCPFVDYVTFVVYFPQLLQGPILLHGDLIGQLQERERRRFDAERFAGGIVRFVTGLAKKALLADTLAKAVNFGYESVPLLDSPSAAFLAAGYMLELYFDFSGYCDMAVGLGRMFGLEIPENFDAPLCSASVKEFWRRWHITLGRFFTKYVYIPLGGSRRGRLRTLCNTMIVFLLSGLWHGASWNFVFWGFLHGVGVAASSFKRTPQTGSARLPKRLLTFVYVTLAFVFFRAATVSEGFAVIGTIFRFRWNGFLFRMAKALDITELYPVTKALDLAAPSLLPWVQLGLFLLFFLLCAVLLTAKKAPVLTERKVPSPFETAVLAVLFVWSVLSLSGVSTFLYFTF